MPDDYDDLIAQRRSERESAAQDEALTLRNNELIRRLNFHRRNALFDAIRRRASELEKRYPDLGQLFCDTSLGSVLTLRKSKFPTGTYAIGFDEAQHAVILQSRYQDGAGSESSFEMRAAPTGQDTVELWSNDRAFTDEEIVKRIFDEFIAGVA